MLLIDADDSLVGDAVNGLREGRFRVDARMLETIYWGLHAPLRPLLAGTAAAAFLPPQSFRRVWLDALRYGDKDSRGRLAEGLSAFINHHPDQAAVYEDHIRSFTRDRNLVVRRTGLLLLAALDSVTVQDLKLVARYLRSTSADMRLCALGVVQRWTLRFDALPSHVRDFLGSPGLRVEVARAKSDTDEVLRVSGRNAERLLRSQGMRSPLVSRRATKRGTRGA